jgi:hypothetical protein
MYLNGNIYIKSDSKKALTYFIKASARGDSTGTVFYADALLNGENIKQDVKKAIHLYQNIIDKKDHDIALCGYKLGKIYENGKYVKQDIDKAIHYYKLAFYNGYKSANKDIDRLTK